jgi:hypothetical protein
MKYLNASYNMIDMESFDYIERFQSLQSLQLNHIKTNGSFIRMKLNKIQYLNLNSCHYIESDQMKLILNDIWKTVLTLKISESIITSNDFYDSYKNYINVNDNNDNDLIESFPLEYIDLSWNEDIESCHICPLLLRCPNIRHAIFRCCSSFDSTVLKVLSKTSQMNLIELNMSRCLNVNNDAIFTLAKYCPNLLFLDISWSFITTESIIDLLNHCKDIQTLILQGCKGLGEDLIDYLLIDTNMLINEMKGIPSQTDQSHHQHQTNIIPLYNSQDLKFLDLSWVNMISKSLASKLTKIRTGLRVLDYYNELYENGDVIAEFL